MHLHVPNIYWNITHMNVESIHSSDLSESSDETPPSASTESDDDGTKLLLIIMKGTTVLILGTGR